MKTTHPAFWGAGWAGLAVGGALTLFGLTSLSDVASLAGGYGLIMMGTSLFLLAGLKVVEKLRDRAEAIRVHRAAIARLPVSPRPQGFVPAASSSTSPAPASARVTTS